MPTREWTIASTIGRHLLAALPATGFGLAGRTTRRRVWARAFRRAFEELGPAFVKLGQLISVRPDEFGDELAAAMESLQDAATPLPASVIEAVIVGQFGEKPHELWDSFDPEPVASASVAQVHRARLREAYRPVWGPEIPEGTRVAVKVVRPGAAESVRGDVAALRRLAVRPLVRRLLPHVDITALADEFDASVERELDLRVEGRLADRFGFDFHDDPVVSAPRTVWSRTASQVLTMEFIEGWRLSQIEAATEAGIDCRSLAVHGATAFMRQVFELGRYHADLHPSNLFITPDGAIAYLDFGITGTVSEEARADMAQVMAALAYRDADRALRYSSALGVEIPAGREAAVRDGLGRLLDSLERPDGTADLAGFGVGFLRLLAEHGVRVPAGYGLLVKSLVTVEGVARMLYPDIDIIAVARPFVTRLLARHFADPVRVAERVPAALKAALRELTV